jgi:hypothetical protein
MNNFSPILAWVLRHLFGTRLRFALLLLCQVGGFFLTASNRSLDAMAVYKMSYWGLLTPVLLLFALRSVAVHSQQTCSEKSSQSEGSLAAGE